MQDQGEGAIPCESLSGVSESGVSVDRSCEIFLQPQQLLFFDLPSLLALSLLSRRHCSLIREHAVSLGYWPAMCNALCAYAGLYSPVLVDPERVLPRFNYRRHFFEDLWSVRRKWRVSHTHTQALDDAEGEKEEGEGEGEDDVSSYKVRVSCRFRPGEPPAGRVCLPLHQFLKIKRQKQQQGQQGKEEKKALLVGEKDPDEFLDPVLGSLMKDPVLLAPSQRVVDRSVAIQCVLRGGRDPFNNRKLTMEMLLPQPELAARIEQWKSERVNKRKADVALELSELKHLVEDVAVDQELLEALLEVERVRNAMQRARHAQEEDDENQHTRHDETPPTEHIEPVPFNPATAENEDFVREILAENQQIAEEEQMLREMQYWDPSAAFMQNEPTRESEKSSKKAEIARIVEVNPDKALVSMHVPGAGVRPFHFTTVLAQRAEQTQVYESTTKDAVHATLNGCNACVMCYGQTGSGKTFSFLGPERCLEDEALHVVSADSLPQSMGIVLRAAQELFQAKETFARKDISLSLVLQVVEVYEEKLTDLLTGKSCSARRDTGQVVGASEAPCHNITDLLDNLRLAHSRQRFAETAMNERSSRAHTVLILHVRQQSKNIPMVHKGNAQDAPTLLVQSQLHLVDLAGSERVKKSKVTGTRMREAVGINSSLLVLGKVISALVKGHSHVPYLESKLTTLLKAAFGGNARTMVMINARSDEEHGDETLQSLRFGERCSMISNSLRQTATSLESTLQSMDAALHAIEEQLKSLASRNKQHLDSYKSLQMSYDGLQRKRQELIVNHNQNDSVQNWHNSKVFLSPLCL